MRYARTIASATANGTLQRAIRYAVTTLTLRLLPCRQCTSTPPLWWRSMKSHISSKRAARSTVSLSSTAMRR